jgi:hypothetical protein
MACGITFLWLDRPGGAPAGMGLPPARDASEQERYVEIAAGFDEVFRKPVQSYANAKLAELGLLNLPASFTVSRVLLADAYMNMISARHRRLFTMLALCRHRRLLCPSQIGGTISKARAGSSWSHKGP